MATVYSSEVSVGTYNRIRIKCDYSGTSATLTVQFRRTSSYTTTWSDTQATLTLGGTEKAAAYNYTGTVGESWVDLRPAISGYTISTSGGTYNWVFNNPGSSSVLGCSGTITIPAQSSAPTGLGANNIVRGVESFTANVYITSWGTGTGTRYRELQCWTYDPSSLVQPRRYQPAYGDSLSGDITVNNSSGYTQASGPLNITGNTKYVLGLYASNGTADTGSQRLGEYTTLAYAPEVVISSISSTSATLAYSTKADGGVYAKTYEYSIDGGTTWTTFATVSSGSATTGTFTVSGLAAATVTVMQTRVTTTAGTTVGPNITLNTNAGPKLYGSVNSQANGATDLYGGVSGVAERIAKLYGSVNGQTKLTYQGFGHLGYGIVTYYTDDGHTATDTLMLQKQSSLNRLYYTSANQTKTIDGVSLKNSNIKSVYLTWRATSTPEYFLGHCTALEEVDISESKVAAVGDYFLYNCSNFNSKIVFPDSVTSIGPSLMYGCSSFNQDISLPQSITHLGPNNQYNGPGLFRNCPNMTATVNVGSLPTSIISATDILSFSTTNSTDPVYATGVKIAGANRAAWLSYFPNSTSSPYRKLIDAGY